MIRIELSWPDRPAAAPRIRTRDDIHNVLVRLFRAGGIPYHRLTAVPARYGFGAVTRPIPNTPWRQLRRVSVGTTDPDLAAILQHLTPNLLQHAAPTWPLTALTLTRDTTWWPTVDTLAVYAISPIRALRPAPEPRRTHAILEIGPDWVTALNHAMQRRFGRPFALAVEPDVDYLQTVGPRRIARMAVKTLPSGRDLVLPGLVLPFVLSGPNPDLRDAWFAGLGAGTGMGFGWLEVQSA